MCMTTVVSPDDGPIESELIPTIKYKVVFNPSMKNLFYYSISYNGRHIWSCLDHGSIMLAYPAADHRQTYTGHHVFDTITGAEQYAEDCFPCYSETTVVPVLVWGKAYKFSFNAHYGWATEFLTAAPESVGLV